jgi:hypothetical protein
VAVVGDLDCVAEHAENGRSGGVSVAPQFGSGRQRHQAAWDLEDGRLEPVGDLLNWLESDGG